jgi:hypothetical protein
MYLATVARHLAAQSAFSQQRFSFQQGDPCRPVLELAAGGKGAAALKLRLLPCLSPTAFAASKLAPDRNNVRWAVPPASAAAAKAAAGAAAAPAATAAAGPGSEAAARTAGEASTSGREQQQAKAQQAPALLLPTPYYNSAVLQDMLLLHHQALLQQALRRAPRLADAVLLLKVWARQQQLHKPPAGFSGCLLTWLLLHVTHTNPVVSGAAGGVPDCLGLLLLLLSCAPACMTAYLPACLRHYHILAPTQQMHPAHILSTTHTSTPHPLSPTPHHPSAGHRHVASAALPCHVTAHADTGQGPAAGGAPRRAPLPSAGVSTLSGGLQAAAASGAARPHRLVQPGGGGQQELCDTREPL